jgi:hypothetical protein
MLASINLKHKKPTTLQYKLLKLQAKRALTYNINNQTTTLINRNKNKQKKNLKKPISQKTHSQNKKKTALKPHQKKMQAKKTSIYFLKNK